MVATHNIKFRIEASVFFVSAYVYTQTGITISSSQAFQKDRERGRQTEREGGGERGLGRRQTLTFFGHSTLHKTLLKFGQWLKLPQIQNS